jgi:putative radical SAM enzyme (TIGR03279 family)
VIKAVAPESLGSRAGLREGDHLVEINGRALRDVIDVRVYGADDHLTLVFTRNGSRLSARVDRRYGEPLGLEFTSPTFDPVRVCRNRCEFCFVAQMPPGLRRSLYLRDDDYRYSFLFGSYVTLNNLQESDWTRIGEQHLSPLFVSVHATEPGLRQRMMGGAGAHDVMARLVRLVSMGIDVHTQVVVVSGVNDRSRLRKTIRDLASLYPGVQSVSIVPVGVTRYHRGMCRILSRDEMVETMALVRGEQALMLARAGVRFTYLSDEWYLALGEAPPPQDEYDGIDLAENGVGAARDFLDHATSRLASVVASPERQTLVTGVLFAPLLRQVVGSRANVAVVPIANIFFGETVTVAGLLTGRDVVNQLAGRPLGTRVVLPPRMLGGPGETTLDGMTAGEIGQLIDCPAVVGGLPPRGRGAGWTW